MDLVLRDRHDLFMGDCADSYESAICGFLVGGITLNLGVISRFFECELLRKKKYIAQNDWDGYFWITEKAGSNSLSVMILFSASVFLYCFLGFVFRFGISLILVFTQNLCSSKW